MPPSVSARLDTRLRTGVQRLALARPAGLASLILAVPQVPPVAAVAPHFLFSCAQAKTFHAGYGVAAEWHAHGVTRLRELAQIARSWPDTWQRLDLDATGSDAVALFGFAADEHEPASADWPNAMLWVPEVALQRCGDGAALIFSTALPVEAESLLERWRLRLAQVLTAAAPQAAQAPLELMCAHSLPEQTAWQRLVNDALAHIQVGTFAKVVLARQLTVRGSRAFELNRLCAALAERFPTCQIVHLRRGASSFVAATPERLLQLHGRRLESDALAGTVPRADAAQGGAALLHSEKNLREHHLVVEAIRAAITPCCALPPRVPATPRLLRLRNAHHLWSPLCAEVKAGVDVFELAERLHPTPATNGQPRAAARDWLRTVEPFARGWYTGAAGIVTPSREGTLWVLLRCARIGGAEAALYAGSGIVAGSEPEAEWAETAAKLEAMLAALRLA